MHKTVDDLASILGKQIENYRDLKKLVLEERKAIIANDLKALSDVTSRIGLLVVTNNQLETERINLVNRLAGAVGITGPNPVLTDIARRLDEPLSQRLLSLREEAVHAMAEAQRQNRINAEMLKYSANLVDTMLRYLIDPVSNEAIYGNTGQAKQRASVASLLDQHA